MNFPDLNAGDSSDLNAGREGLLYDHKRRVMDLFINGPIDEHGEEPAEEYVTGIIGQAVHGWIDNSIGIIPDCEDNWGRRSFTIRMWFKFGAVGGPIYAVGGFQIPIFDSGIFGPSFVFDLKKSGDVLETGVAGVCGVGNQYVIRAETLTFRVSDGLGALLGSVTEADTSTSCLLGPGPEFGDLGDFGEQPEFLTPDVWHRVVCWYDKDTLEVGMQLDDRTPVTTTATSAIPRGHGFGFEFNMVEVLPGPFDIAYDETGLWHDYVWTEDERDADWNGGDGLGWPDPDNPEEPNILNSISKRPFAYFRFEPEDERPNLEIIDDFFGPNNFPRIIRNKANPQSR